MTDTYDMYVKKNSIFFQNNHEWGQGDSKGKAAALFRLIQDRKLDIKTVAEIGCGAGGVLENLQKLLPPETVLQGYDIAQDAIELARPKQNNKLTFHQRNFLETGVKVDLLVMADVFEHVDNYYDFLRQARSKAKHFLFSIPLDLSLLTLLRPGMLERQQICNGHIHYFSEKSALLALKHAGYKIIDSCLISRIIDLQRKMPIPHYLFWRSQLALLGRRWATILSGECILGVYACVAD
jgi:SAM-dependent methyltransferase